MSDADTRSESEKALHEFISRAAGTLPETITEHELEALNEGLRFLFTGLRGAYRQYQLHKGYDRQGAMTALLAVLKFVNLFKQPYLEHLDTPFQKLIDALNGLNAGDVAPMVRLVSKPAGGRGAGPATYAGLRGMVAAIVDYLMEDHLGEKGLSHPQACNEVYKVLKKGGIRPQRRGQKITSTTVSNWREEVSKARGRGGVNAAVEVYERIRFGDERKYIDNLPNQKARLDYLLGRLAELICRVFPPEPPRPGIPD
jgi:hypothetical protein